MEERLRFVGRLLDGESISDVCREFGISRKTGYKIYSRYREHGLFALPGRSACQPVASASREPDRQPEARQAALGGRTIRELLVRRLNGDVKVPAKSTNSCYARPLDLVRRMSKRRNRAAGAPLDQQAFPTGRAALKMRGSRRATKGNEPKRSLRKSAARYRSTTLNL